jgi:nucleoside-diphosphate-sugar epimerase
VLTVRIFLAGGSGVVGRRALPQLVADGHEATVLVRSPEKAADLHRAGARTTSVSLFDPAALTAAVAGHDVVVNLATSIPPFSRAARSSAWKANDQIRTEGSANLVAAASEAGAGRYVQESVAFLYADAGTEWIFEDHPVRPSPITASAAVAESHARRLLADGAAVVVLRFGAFYGPDSSHTIAALRMARLGLGTTPGHRDAYLSSVSTDDAAAAVVAAITAPPGTYNVVDDDPVTRQELDDVLARAVGRKRLRPMPQVAVRMLGAKLDHVTRSQRVGNRALRENTAWEPRHPSVRVGLPAVATAVRNRRAPSELDTGSESDRTLPGHSEG